MKLLVFLALLCMASLLMLVAMLGILYADSVTVVN